MRNYRLSLLFLLAAVLALLLAGCSKDEAADVVRVDITQEAQGDFSGMPSGDMPSFEGTPSGERPDGAQAAGQDNRQNGRENADKNAAEDQGASGSDAAITQQDDSNAIYGQVAAIVGNKVTLTLGARDESGTLTYGEETAEYLLPVGMAIGTGDFSSVTKGMTLRITLETLADGSENITGVSIVSR